MRKHYMPLSLSVQPFRSFAWGVQRYLGIYNGLILITYLKDHDKLLSLHCLSPRLSDGHLNLIIVQPGFECRLFVVRAVLR